MKILSHEKDLLKSAYRFLIADYFPVGGRAVTLLEHGGANDKMEHYSGVVYWYGVNAPSLMVTDFVNVCDAESIQLHQYQSSTAEKPYITGIIQPNESVITCKQG